MSRVVAGKYQQARPPMLGTLVWWMVLDRWQAPGWLWGVMGTVVIAGWIAWLICCFRDTPSEPQWKP